MTASETNDPSCFYKLGHREFAGVGLVSAIYFADIFLRSSRKCFWFDELITTYLCRLPDFSATWAAVLHGADFNPPLFYLLTRLAQRLFGEGLIATRLPAMIGVWLFGVCLFVFVARRCGVISGFIAGVFPFFSLAQYYAYEARAHGIVLGWCGLALVFWQKSKEDRAANLWLGCFGLSLAGALLTHVYAVYVLFPFALVEIYDLYHKGRLDWGVTAVLLVSLLSVIVPVYLPLFHMYRSMVQMPFFTPSHDAVQRSLVSLIGPGIGILVIAIGLSALEGSLHTRPETTRAVVPTREMLLAIGFACMPLVGLLGAKLTRGPFVERYFLSSIAGYAMLLGFACSSRLGSWTARALAGCMLLLMVGDLGTTMYLSGMNRMALVEPSSGVPLNMTPLNPMARYETVVSDHNSLDILVVPSLEYLYLFRYAPRAVVSHLYFGAPAHDINLAVCSKLEAVTHLGLKTTAFNTFIASHSRFLVYETNGGDNLALSQAAAVAGYRILSAQGDAAGIMYEYEK